MESGAISGPVMEVRGVETVVFLSDEEEKLGFSVVVESSELVGEAFVGKWWGS
jgi:hypothetical protein